MKAPCACLWFFAAAIAIGGSAHAADPPDMVELRTQYETAVAQSVQKLAELYKSRLQELQKQYRAANDSAGIASTSEELIKLGATGSAQPAAPAGNAFAAAIPAGGVGDELYFAGKSWYTPVNSEYRFGRDGAGERIDAKGIKTAFVWRKLESGIVEVAGRYAPDQPAVRWYFKFDNDKTALMGDNAAKLPWECRAGR